MATREVETETLDLERLDDNYALLLYIQTELLTPEQKDLVAAKQAQIRSQREASRRTEKVA